MRRLIVKIFCKYVELLCRFFTFIRNPFQRDPTKILVDNLTTSQKKARVLIESVESIKLAVIIPFRDRWDLTQLCLESLLNQITPANTQLKIYLVDNASSEEATASGLAEMKLKWPDIIEIVRDESAFNYSHLNNQAAKIAQGAGCNWLFFVNNDIEFISDNSLAEFLNFAVATADIGATGCTLEFADGKIQHLFVAPGVKILAAHPLKGKKLDPTNEWFKKPRIVAAVTGAALLVSNERFFQVGGFDTELSTLGQDVDLCLKLQKIGLENWCLPSTRLIHHESVSRGGYIDPDQVQLVYERWGEFLIDNPCFSPRFCRWSESPAFSLGEPQYPWKMVLPPPR
jgi:O-antigen biosynthesis protein